MKLIGKMWISNIFGHMNYVSYINFHPVLIVRLGTFYRGMFHRCRTCGENLLSLSKLTEFLNEVRWSFFSHVIVDAANDRAISCKCLVCCSSNDAWHVFSLQRQRDPRLNEILFPFFDLKRARQIIDTYEPSDDARSQGMCAASFSICLYLFFEEFKDKLTCEIVILLCFSECVMDILLI